MKFRFSKYFPHNSLEHNLNLMKQSKKTQNSVFIVNNLCRFHIDMPSG